MTAEPLATDGPTISTKAILDLVPGITFRQLDYWTRTGLLRTVGWDGQHNPPTGHGHHRMHPTSEVAVLAIVIRLIGVGFHVGAAFDVARALAEQPRVALPGGFDVTDTAT